MAARAYVLITAEPAKTRNVGEKLRDVRGAMVHEVLGPYDFIVELEADTAEELTAVLRTKIRSMPGINDTLTCVCF